MLLLFLLLSQAFCSLQCCQVLLEITLQCIKTLSFNLCSSVPRFLQACLFFHKSIDLLLPSRFGLCCGLFWCLWVLASRPGISLHHRYRWCPRSSLTFFAHLLSDLLVAGQGLNLLLPILSFGIIEARGSQTFFNAPSSLLLSVGGWALGFLESVVLNLVEVRLRFWYLVDCFAICFAACYLVSLVSS